MKFSDEIFLDWQQNAHFIITFVKSFAIKEKNLK